MRESRPCVPIFMQQHRRSHKQAYAPEHHRVHFLIVLPDQLLPVVTQQEYSWRVYAL